MLPAILPETTLPSNTAIEPAISMFIRQIKKSFLFSKKSILNLNLQGNTRPSVSMLISMNQRKRFDTSRAPSARSRARGYQMLSGRISLWLRHLRLHILHSRKKLIDDCRCRPSTTQTLFSHSVEGKW